MASSHLIRLGKLTGKNVILVALKHNKRTLQIERGAEVNIDAARTCLNYALHGLDTPENIAIHANVQIAKAGIRTLRKDAVMGVELLFSLPINRHQRVTRPFFIDCYEWIKKSFAGELLSFDVHLDEAAPHAHAIILPLINGKMQGSEMVGNKGNLYRLINLFHEDVASRYGLSNHDKKRLSKADKAYMESEVLKRLKGDSVMNSCIWAIIRDSIKLDPMYFAQSLSIKPPEKTQTKHFVDYKRGKGKGAFIK